MKRIVSMLLCALLLVSLLPLGGCVAKPVEQDNNPARTVVDMTGKKVELPETVDNYCVLYSSAVGLCGLLDEGYAHVSILPNLWIFEEWVYKLFPQLPQQAITVNKRTVTAEQIIEKGAQVVFWNNQSEELIQALESFGVACVNIAFSSNEELLQVTDIVADVFGTEYAHAMADKFGADLEATRQRIAALAAKVPESEKANVLFLGATDVMTAYGTPSYEYGWSSNLNINYILPEDPSVKKVDLTMEQVLEYDPEIIIFESTVDPALYSDPVWSQLQAAKNGKLIPSPYVFDVWPKGGVESIVTYPWAFATIYPDYAGEIDLEQEIRDYYSEYFQYEMSDSELSALLGK